MNTFKMLQNTCENYSSNLKLFRLRLKDQKSNALISIEYKIKWLEGGICKMIRTDLFWVGLFYFIFGGIEPHPNICVRLRIIGEQQDSRNWESGK